MAGAMCVFGNVAMEGVSPMYRDSVYNFARTLARMSGFSRHVRINGRSVAEDDAESIHDVIVEDEEDTGASDVTCRAQFDIINRPDDYDDGEDGAAGGQLATGGERASTPVFVTSVSSPLSPDPVSDAADSTPEVPLMSSEDYVFTVDDEFSRLADMSATDLEVELQELCGGSPCVSIEAPSEPWSWLGSLSTPSYEPADGAHRPRDPVAEVLNREEDPRQGQYEMTLLDARGQMPTRKSDVPQSALTRADFGMAGAISFGEDFIAPWFERGHRPMAPGTSKCTCVYCRL